MKFQIGFSAEDNVGKPSGETAVPQVAESTPVKSVVQVHFEDRNRTLAYFNDRFDLRVGDIVYVDGKLAGLRGRVVQVDYNFKIKLSDYHRVIAVADTSVRGTLYLALSHLVAFDPAVLPREKIASWFLAPAAEPSEYVCGSDSASFPLENLQQMNVTEEIASRGHAYYLENKVRYLCLDGAKGYAIVEGSRPYELEFTYAGGAVSGLNCSCFCANACKHEFAAMLQLQETLNFIEAHYAGQYSQSSYFAAIQKGFFLSFAAGGNKTGCFTFT